MVAVMAIVVAISSVGLFVGTANSFKKKIEYLSDNYAIYECKIEWTDYPSYQNNWARSKDMDYEVQEAKSWTAFKSLIKDRESDGSFLDSIFYEPHTHVIWFDAIEWKDFGEYQLTTYFYQS